MSQYFDKSSQGRTRQIRQLILGETIKRTGPVSSYSTHLTAREGKQVICTFTIDVSVGDAYTPETQYNMYNLAQNVSWTMIPNTGVTSFELTSDLSDMGYSYEFVITGPTSATIYYTTDAYGPSTFNIYVTVPACDISGSVMATP